MLDPDDVRRCCARLEHEVARLRREYEAARTALLIQHQDLQRRCPHTEVTDEDHSTDRVRARIRRCQLCGAEYHHDRWYGFTAWA